MARPNQELQIRRLATGRYRVRGRHGRGRNAPQWQETFETIEEAEDFRSDYYRRHVSGQTSHRLTEGRRSFADYVVEVYWPRHAKLRLEEQTRDNYRELLAAYLEPYFGTFRMNEITRGDIEDYLARSLATCSDRGLRNPCDTCRNGTIGETVTVTLANGDTRRRTARCELAITTNTANSLLVLLKSVIGFAVRNDHLLGDGPAAKIKPLPDHEAPKGPIRIVDPRDIAFIALHFEGQDDADILEFHAYMGLRPGEIFARRFRDAFNDDGSLKQKLDVYSALYYRGRDRIREKHTKNRQNRRVLIPGPIGDTLKRRFLAAGRNPDALIFPWENGGYYDPRTWRKHRYIPAMTAAGFGPETDKYRVPYALRHTTASLLAHDPTRRTLKEIANQLGHSQQTCERHYLELFEEADHLRGKDMDTVILEARASVRSLKVTPVAMRKRNHRVSFPAVLRLAGQGLDTTKIALELGFPIGTIRGSIRAHGYRWTRVSDNRWQLIKQEPTDAKLALAARVCALACTGRTNTEISEETGRSKHKIPGLMALGGYRRTRGAHSQVVPIRRDEDGAPRREPLAPNSLAIRRLTAIAAAHNADSPAAQTA